MKTRESIEAQSSDESRADTPTSTRKPSPADRIKKWRWKPGQSGNPRGHRGEDISQIIARAVFEQNPEAIYKAYAKLLMKGSAFGFQVVAERGYGKLKETRDTGSEFNNTPDDQIQNEIESILARLGLARAADDAAEVGVATARAEKANGKAKTSDVLS